jgi:hypothetical protein
MPVHGRVRILLTFKLLSDARIVLNMHEIAITSGFAAAYRLGADFPHVGDEECVRLFRLYLCLSHATRLVRILYFADHIIDIFLTIAQRKGDREGKRA